MKSEKTKLPEFPMKGCGRRGAKWERHLRKGRREDGRTKTKSCQATWLHRYACQVSRSYRDVLYPSIIQSIRRKAGRGGPVVETHGLGRRGICRTAGRV
jgi:hypothetical protein